MAYRLQAPDLSAAVAADAKLLEEVHTGAMRDLVAGFTGDLRGQVLTAGFGQRLANTWRGQAFPRSGASLEPAGYVTSRAPKIVGAFATGATIVPVNGQRYLAIPTKNVPLKGRGKRMTPLDVEVAFDQDLIVRPGRRGQLLAFVNVIAAKNKRGFRKATRGRLAQGRQVKLVLMFTLVRSVRLEKRLDPDGAFERWAGRFDQLVQARWDASGLGSAR